MQTASKLPVYDALWLIFPPAPIRSGFPGPQIRESMGDARAENALGEMRGAGVTGLLIYCSDYRCSHHIAIGAEPWPDDVRLSDLEPRFVCKACGRRGADIRLTFAPARVQRTKS